MPSGTLKIPLGVTPGGVREDLNITAIPDGVWLSSSNLISRRGQARPRPGYTITTALVPAVRILGFGFRGAHADVHGTSPNLVIHSTTVANHWDGTTLTDITGTWTISTADEAVRMKSFSSGGVVYLCRVNRANELDIWDGTGTFVSPLGSPPRALDLCVSNGRVILVNTIDTNDNPYQVRWCDFNDINAWPIGSANTAELSETSDELIACEALGPLSAAFYKDDSLWIGQAQASRNPFQFQLVATVPGPVSPAAVISYRGAHYWLAKDGVVYSFDGTKVTPISAGLIHTFRTSFDWIDRLQTHGVAMALAEPELWWWYPKIGSAFLDAFMLNLVTGAMTHHTFADVITASAPWLLQAEVSWDSVVGSWDVEGVGLGSWDALGSQTNPTAVIGAVGGQVYQFGVPATDDGTLIPWTFTTPWRQPNPDGRAKIDAMRAYWIMEDNPLAVTVALRTTDSLGEQERTTERTYDLSIDDAHLVTFGDLEGTFVQVTQSAASATTTLAHRGGVLTAWPRGLV